MPTIKWSLHPGQSRIHRSKARLRVVACGRRWGKTTFAWEEILTAALRSPGPYGWIAPWYKELLPITLAIDEFTAAEIFTEKHKISIGGIPVYRYVKLPNGSEIYFHSADKEDSLRGLKYRGVVLDEAPSIKRDRWEKEIAPSLMDYGGWGLFIGSPKGRNWFHEAYMRGQDRQANPEWESWAQSSYANAKEQGGFIGRLEIDFIAGQLPELTRRQEIFAEFLEGEGVVFRRVDEAVAGSLGPAEADRSYSLGVDLAKTQDFTVLTALDDRGHVRGFDRFQQIDWGFQKARIRSFAKTYPGQVWVDSTGLGDPIYDDLQRSGLRIRGYKFTSESKRQLIENLSMALDQGRITIPAELKVLLNELKAYGYDLGGAGSITYGAPEGLHDDAVTSLALAVWGFRWVQPPGYRLGRTVK